MYESFYGLSAKPFRLRPDPHFFYGSKGHKRAMSYLEYGLSQGEGFIVITGEVGAGKTTLVRNLFNNLPSEQIVAAHIVNTHLDSDDTLRMVVSAFGLPYENVSKADLLTRLEQFLRTADQQGKRALLVVDEAQNLKPGTVEELRMLSNFQTDDKCLLQTFLVGQPEFRTTLHSPGMQQLRQRVIASYHLGPMDAEETRHYIEHRLTTVGWKGDPAFSAGAYATIFDNTGGIPRKVNTLCDRLLLMGFLEEMHEFDTADVEEVIKDIAQEFELPTTPADLVKQADAATPVLSDMPASSVSSTPAMTAAGQALASMHSTNGSNVTYATSPITDERLMRLEKSVVSVLNILKKLVATPAGANTPLNHNND